MTRSNEAPSSTVLDLFRLEGRRALVTGGHKGLGLSIARALAESGAEVAIASRSARACELAASDIARLAGARTAAFTADVTSADAVARLADEVDRGFGPVDILVNNAGVNVRGNVQDLSEADWDAVIDTNLKGPFLCARQFGPPMAARGWGRIINLASILSVVALPGRAPYASSKAGLASLTRVLALEWAAQGVTVNAIGPGPFATDMNLPLLNDPVKYQAFVQKIPMGRWGELHEIAGAAVFLASNAASFVTGALLMVDGGWTAQ
jgi:NAD(P)-dependent dehydrogenase (short-subunit alcohol dehydrogenase family)